MRRFTSACTTVARTFAVASAIALGAASHAGVASQRDVSVPAPYPAGKSFCWDSAAARYGVHPDLLRAIAHVESRTRPEATNKQHQSRTGTVDIGMMQINSSHLPNLARFGITEESLFDACTSTMVGAWILAHEIKRRGATWEATGAYNAACVRLKGKECERARKAYVAKVQSAFQRLLYVHEGAVSSTGKIVAVAAIRPQPQLRIVE